MGDGNGLRNGREMRTAQGGLTWHLVEQIGSHIVRGETAAGENLPNEAQLAEKYEASRTVVREAVKMLTAKGLVGSRPRRGTYVEPEGLWNILDRDVLRWILHRRFDKGLLRQFQIVRRAIEPIACMEAARIANHVKIKIIADAVESLALAEDSESALQADIDFHRAILFASENRFFIELGEMVETALRFSIRYTNAAKGVSKADLNDHKVIFVAISKGQAMKAKRSMEALLDEAIHLTHIGATDIPITERKEK